MSPPCHTVSLEVALGTERVGATAGGAAAAYVDPLAPIPSIAQNEAGAEELGTLGCTRNLLTSMGRKPALLPLSN